MNERIKLLAEQAQIRLFEDKSFGWSVIAGTDQHLEKFSQLIVQECRDMFVVGSVSWNLLNDKLEHFGVEEHDQAAR
jgi:hypothetical protein